MTEKKQNTSLTNTYAANSASKDMSFYELMRRIPDYHSASPELREAVDQIKATLDPDNPETARAFGNMAQSARTEVANRILEAQENSSSAFIREPLEETLGLIKGIDLEAMEQKVSTLARQGGEALKRNPGMLAATAAAAFLAGPIALLGGGVAIAAKEKASQLRQKARPETLRELEAHLREGIANFKPMVRKLEAVRGQISGIQNNIRDLGRANQSSLIETTLHIVAGREQLREAVEELLPRREQAGDIEGVERLNSFIGNLSHKISIHEQTRNGSIMDVTKLANLMEATNDNDKALESILTDEIHNHLGNLAANAMVADTMRTSAIINEFRKQTEKDASRAIKATNEARKVAASNQIDSPERLAATLKNLRQMEKLIEDRIQAAPALEEKRTQLKQQVNDAAGNVIEAQARSAQQAAGTLPLGQSARPQIGSRPKGTEPS